MGPEGSGSRDDPLFLLSILLSGAEMRPVAPEKDFEHQGIAFERLAIPAAAVP